MNIRVEIQRNPAFRGYEVWITNESTDGQIQIAKPMELQFANLDAGMPGEPTMRFRGGDADGFLEAFATGLGRAGYKPDQLKINTEQIAALSYHLEDMRRLVFKDKYVNR